MVSVFRTRPKYGVMPYEGECPQVVTDNTIQHLVPVSLAIVGINDLCTDGERVVGKWQSQVFDLTSHMDGRSIDEVVTRERCHTTRQEIGVNGHGILSCRR